MFYRLVRRLFLLVAGPAFRFHVDGASRLPRDGAAILIAPHRSWLDPACVGGAVTRKVSFLIVDAVYDRPLTRWFYRAMGSIRVAPRERASAGALREAMRRLERGELVGVFPEGRVIRPGERGAVHPGAALLAVRSGAPVYPIDIDGSARAWPHRRWPRPAPVSVRVLEAIVPPVVTERGEIAAAVVEMTRRIETALESLGGRSGEVA